MEHFKHVLPLPKLGFNFFKKLSQILLTPSPALIWHPLVYLAVESTPLTSNYFGGYYICNGEGLRNLRIPYLKEVFFFIFFFIFTFRKVHLKYSAHGYLLSTENVCKLDKKMWEWRSFVHLLNRIKKDFNASTWYLLIYIYFLKKFQIPF